MFPSSLSIPYVERKSDKKKRQQSRVRRDSLCFGLSQDTAFHILSPYIIKVTKRMEYRP